MNVGVAAHADDITPNFKQLLVINYPNNFPMSIGVLKCPGIA